MRLLWYILIHVHSHPLELSPFWGEWYPQAEAADFLSMMGTHLPSTDTF